MTKINEIQAKTKMHTPINAKVISIGETRSVRNGTLQIAEAIIKDDSGEITLSLWNNEIGTVKVNDNITITNGWASIFNDNVSLTVGKFGTLTINE